jgi:hypothetical protein
MAFMSLHSSICAGRPKLPVLVRSWLLRGPAAIDGDRHAHDLVGRSRADQSDGVAGRVSGPRFGAGNAALIG